MAIYAISPHFSLKLMNNDFFNYMFDPIKLLFVVSYLDKNLSVLRDIFNHYLTPHRQTESIPLISLSFAY